MFHKILRKLQHPLIIAGFLFVLIMLVVFYLTYSDSFVPPATPGTVESPSEEVRNGSQKINISIAPADEAKVDGAPTVPDENDSKVVMEDDSQERGFVSMRADSPTMTVSHAIDAGGRVEFEIENFQKLATQPLRFRILRKDGRELTQDLLKTLAGEKVHFFLIHANLREFSHLIPESTGTSWKVRAPMPTPGTYYAYIVYNDILGQPIAVMKELIVREASDPAILKADPTSGMVSDNGKNSAELNVTRPGEFRRFDFRIRQGENLMEVFPYRESMGLIVVVNQADPKTFVLAPDNGFFDGSNGHIAFTTSLLRPGRYTSFSEFKVGSEVFVYPITFDIGKL